MNEQLKDWNFAGFEDSLIPFNEQRLILFSRLEEEDDESKERERERETLDVALAFQFNPTWDFE